MKQITEDLGYLERIIHKLGKVNTYSQEMTYEDFVTDKPKREAILRNLHLISEEALMISPQTQDRFPDAGLGLLKSFRNAAYLYNIEFDSHVMWKKIRRALPELQKQLQELVNTLQTKKTGRRAA